MSFREKIETGKFLVTSEIAPPKGIDVEASIAGAELVKGRVDAINVTDLQSSVMRAGSLALCHLLMDRGIEPILQMTCRDRNRLALQSDLLSASVLGIENVLILTGDYPTLGDHPESKPVFDLSSVQLLEAARSLESGADMNGNALKGAPRFCLGAVVNPGADPLEPEIIKMEQKVASGARFFQTQAVYDVGLFRRFADSVRHLDATILAGIVLLKSAKMAAFMNDNVAGVSVPADIIREMELAQDKAAKSVEIAARMIKALRPYCRGVHIMPIGWDKVVPRVLDAALL
jgi:5,10-methylenetetrahydrofolate reductase